MNSEFQTRNLSVLILEDEAIIAMSLEDTLLNAGIERIETAMSVREGTELVEKNNFDAAILDLRLPDGSSHDLAKILISNGAKVIFHSGHALSNEVLAEFPDARACSKPSKPEIFLDSLREMFAEET